MQRRSIFENAQNTYHWRGLNVNGKRVEGELKADSLGIAQKELEKQGILLLQIRAKKNSNFFAFKQKVSRKFILDFGQQLSTLTSASIPITAALGIIQNSCSNNAARSFMTHIKSEVEKGKPLSAVLQQYPCYFNTLFCNLVKAGEHSGALEVMLKYLAAYNEKMAQQQQKIKKILLYPSIVMLVAVALTTVLLVFVIPQFQAMFASFGATLPLYTQFIIQLAFFVKIRGWLILSMVTFLLLVVVWARKKKPAFKIMSDRIMLKLPYFGVVVQKAIVARITRTLSITFRAGLPLHDALSLVAGIVANDIYKCGIDHIREQIMQGKALHDAIKASDLFPMRALQLVAIGEESGTLDDMLSKIADYYESEVNYITDNLQNFLEPMIMIILGVVVGGLIVGMYLPIFQLGKML